MKNKDKKTHERGGTRRRKKRMRIKTQGKIEA